MILVDTSVWVDHLRQGEPLLVQSLMQTQVATHPFVVGELACGNLKNRETVIELLQALPPVKSALDHEVRNHAVKDETIVVALLHVFDEVVDSAGGFGGVEFDFDGTFAGFHHDFHRLGIAHRGLLGLG